MPTMATERTDPEHGDRDPGRARPRTATLVWLSVLLVVVAGCVTGAVVVFGWMVDETHFDRPSASFDAFESQVEDLPGVASVDTERWVEAPTFLSPTSWMTVTVEEAGLPGLLDAACSTDYPDPVTWSIIVRTDASTEVSVHTGPGVSSTIAADDAGCPAFGFDVVRLVEELDEVAPGLSVQPAIWEDGRFALVALDEDASTGFTHLLPLVEHADDLIAAAGLDAETAVEINSANLILVLEPGETDDYVELLTELADDGDVESYWADGGGTPIDGVEKVQIVAPEEHHPAIEGIIRSSELHISDFPVRFIG
ncbi:hypothetical protein CLV49_1564 [Labedella gwakjiensis]|uniref:Uncharacterized protein n=2 Tax=Labedella gwakjiensis TaxID=390269 RepID=A0A2P8GVH1_9MICO|nr:hypothetical protein CLV49_1564 [Labedella gwakjiensis]